MLQYYLHSNYNNALHLVKNPHIIHKNLSATKISNHSNLQLLTKVGNILRAMYVRTSYVYYVCFYYCLIMVFEINELYLVLTYIFEHGQYFCILYATQAPVCAVCPLCSLFHIICIVAYNRFKESAKVKELFSLKGSLHAK